MSKRTGWQRHFEDPIPLPDGRVLVTLRDAGDYIASLPKKEAALPEWQTAIEALILVVRQDGPDDVCTDRYDASIHRGEVRVFNPDRKKHALGKAEAGTG